MPETKQITTIKPPKRATVSNPTYRFANFATIPKKKIAPRSCLQFKVGPQFGSTMSCVSLTDTKGHVIEPIICSRIDRGFERIDDEWVGYKRNYFTLVSTFFFKDVSFTDFAKERYGAINPKTGIYTKINYFGLRLVSKCADDGVGVSLIQHTAKRDRGPQCQPPIHPTVPSDLPNHDTVREAANVRNPGKIAKLNKLFFFDKDQYKSEEFDMNGLSDYPTNKIIKVARYERIQFSSSINYKKPSSSNKRFKLAVELVGFIDEDEYITLAYTETPPLIVRGRSPSNYGHSSHLNEKLEKATGILTSTPIVNLEYKTQGSIESLPTNVPAADPESPTKTGQQLADCKSLEIKSMLESMDDYETFRILSDANKELSGLAGQFSNIQSENLLNSGKKKRGRKPKAKQEPKEKILKPKKKAPRVQKQKKIKVKKSDQVLTDITNAVDLNSVAPKLLFERDADSKSPEPEDPNIFREYDFDSSIVELHPDFTQSKKPSLYTNFILSKNESAFSNENYESDIFSIKSGADLMVKAENDMAESFSRYQSNPSEELVNNDYYGDGPSFIAY